MYEIKDLVKEGDYLNMMNTMKTVSEKIENLKLRAADTAPPIVVDVSQLTRQNDRLRRENSTLGTEIQRMMRTISFYDKRLCEAYESLSEVEEQTRKLRNALNKAKGEQLARLIKRDLAEASCKVHSRSDLVEKESKGKPNRVKCNVCLKEVSRRYLKRHQKRAICVENAVDL